MLHTIVSYIRMMLPIIYLVLAWRFGDWKNWKKYYPTILFILSVDFFISNLLKDYPLWTFHGSLLIPNHTIADFMIAFTCFSPMVLIYLSRYPYRKEWYRQFVYILLWFILYNIVEAIFFFAHLITYHHGWNFWWSSIVWVFMFIGLRLHHTKPLLAWLLCFTCTVFLIIYFQIPIYKSR